MTYAITHTDLDGIGCAILLEKIYPHINTFAIDYKELDKMLPVILAKAGDKDTVYITDICMSNEQAEICNTHGNINHVDHHSSGKAVSDKYPWSFTDVTHCATYHLFNMLSRYANIQDYSDFVNLVDNYDTWGHGTQPTEEAKELNRLLYMVGAETFVERFKMSGKVELTPMEKAIIAADRFQEEVYLRECATKTKAMKDPNGNTFLLIAAERYTSSLGNYLLNQYEEADYVLILDMLKDKASLRSKGKVDVGEMAKECGGGGHKKAAGFQMNDQALRSFWRCSSCEWFKLGQRGLHGNQNLHGEVSDNNVPTTPDVKKPSTQPKNKSKHS